MDSTAAIEFARELIVAYGLVGWRAELDRAVRRFGACHHSRKLITLSQQLVQLNNEAAVLDTILHEIAHALAGSKAGHGPEWRKIAKSLGCSAQRCYSLSHTVQPPARITLRCANCGHTVQRIRAPRRKVACSVCCNRFSRGRFDARYILDVAPIAHHTFGANQPVQHPPPTPAGNDHRANSINEGCLWSR